MSIATLRRVMTVCGVGLVVLGVLGAIFARDALHRDGQILAIIIGVIGLAFAHLFLPWAQRRKAERDAV
jgi:uncharacterized membrane protein HdeD (DUF308 family)